MGSKSAKNNSSSKPKECFDLFSDEHTGDPFQFNVDIDDVECRHKIVKAIQKFGGVVTDSPEEKERRIRLVDPDSRKIYRKEDGDIFSFKFIEECVAKGQLPESLVPYRINFKSIYEEYEAMDVLLGRIKWSNVPKTWSGKVRMSANDNSEDIELSDIEDENVLKEVNEIPYESPQKPAKTTKSKELKENSTMKCKEKVSKSSGTSSFDCQRVSKNIKVALMQSSTQKEANKKVSAWLSRSSAKMIDNPAPSIATSFRSLNTTGGGREPYTRKEEASIVKDIVDNRAYNKLKGVQYWRDCEDRGFACKGNRTWQSMKERFRKKIGPNIHIYELTDQELGCFRKCLSGIPVDLSSSDEDTNDQDCDSEAETVIPPNHSTPNSIENGIGRAASHSTPKSKKSNAKTKQNSTPTKKSDDDNEAVTTELEIRTVNVPRSSPRLAGNTRSSPDLLEDVPKKRHKLWNQKQASRTSQTSSRLSMMSETPGRTEEVSKRAKKDYLEIINPTPSTSRARVPPPVFKVPKSPPKRPTITHSDDSRIDENSSSDEGDENRSTISRMSTSSSSYRRSYSFSEEQKIVKWIAKTQRYTEVNGIAMWKLMADSKVLGDRSYQSMKERFRKHIIGKIDMYDLTESEKAAFKSLNARKKFRPVKNGRP